MLVCDLSLTPADKNLKKSICLSLLSDYKHSPNAVLCCAYTMNEEKKYCKSLTYWGFVLLRVNQVHCDITRSSSSGKITFSYLLLCAWIHNWDVLSTDMPQ